ncbi:phosphatidylcholine-sterol acyltransferase-like isoform X2 [Oncorhynchus kisutch]|uniref:Phosphatidylcholine-sterol acyltransferase n=1 Tax=Oncorhynchus kisutch TaxID=8019 RepID=A0A8C7HWQ9_ONCKI|nr:phosphatidylcholine-sterol acyltransferase-like isoform X2 [Oncorhynchus kisutch]
MGHCCTVLLIVFLALQQAAGFWLFDVFPSSFKTQNKVSNNSTPPVLIVPGTAGNQLEAKIDKPSRVHWMCYKKTDDFFTLWIDLNMFMPIGINCWIDNIRIVYNRTTRKSSNSAGVSVRVPGFGQTYTVEFLDNHKLSGENNHNEAIFSYVFFLISLNEMSPFPGYFNNMVTHLVNMGYVRNEAVRAAPYDFRVAPNEQEEYFARLKKLIEDMYERDQQPLYILGHSMGSNYILYFLYQQTQAWKDEYIKGFISLGAPWGGAIKTLRVLASGENLGIPLVSNIKIREQQRMTTTNPWMLPFEEVWPTDHVFISTPLFNYTRQDYQRFFKDIDFEDGWFMWEDTRNLTAGLPPPGVEMYCFYGVGLPTPVTYIYDDQFPNADPIDYVYADGDDTVDSLSLSLCKRWRGKQAQPVHVKEFRSMPHMEIVLNRKVINVVQSILEGRYGEEDSTLMN